jgi:hypothetical protein
MPGEGEKLLNLIDGDQPVAGSPGLLLLQLDDLLTDSRVELPDRRRFLPPTRETAFNAGCSQWTESQKEPRTNSEVLITLVSAEGDRASGSRGPSSRTACVAARRGRERR